MRRQHISISCRLGHRLVKENPRPQLKVQGWVEKFATRPMKPVKENLTIGTWNVRILSAAGKLDLLKEEMQDYQWDILGLNEVRWAK